MGLDSRCIIPTDNLWGACSHSGDEEQHTRSQPCDSRNCNACTESGSRKMENWLAEAVGDGIFCTCGNDCRRHYDKLIGGGENE